MITMIIFLALIAFAFLFVIGTYNKLIRLIEAIKNNQKQIDIQLDRRFKVFESLIKVVNKYMNYEETTLGKVVALRNQAQAAKNHGDLQTQAQAESEISNIASSLNVVFEQYPDLKANQNALQLQEEIVHTENKLSYAKQALNASIETYNATKALFFEAIVVKFFAHLDKEFAYWTVGAEKAEQLENYSPDF